MPKRRTYPCCEKWRILSMRIWFGKRYISFRLVRGISSVTAEHILINFSHVRKTGFGDIEASLKNIHSYLLSTTEHYRMNEASQITSKNSVHET